MKIILHWILISVSVWIVAQIVMGISIDPIWFSLVIGAILYLFNIFIKPIIKILTLPLNLLTLGFFSLIVNGILFWYLGVFIKGFTVTTFWAAFIGSLFVSILNWSLKKIFIFD